MGLPKRTITRRHTKSNKITNKKTDNNKDAVTTPTSTTHFGLVGSNRNKNTKTNNNKHNNNNNDPQAHVIS